MSWSVSASGTPAEVRGTLSEQFKYPLAEGSAGLSDAGERQTVQQTFDLIEQILSTFGIEKTLAVSAYGSMGGSGTDSANQTVSITVTPTS